MEDWTFWVTMIFGIISVFLAYHIINNRRG